MTAKQASQKPDSSIFSKPRLLLFIVLGFALLVYSNSINNGFTNWDDDSHVTANENIKSLSSKSIGNMFKPGDVYMYHPLTILSYAVNYSISKLKPKGYHLTNLLFHLATVTLVFYFMLRLFKRTDVAGMVALLFAIHPLTTEPVNWITGRKDVMFGCFYMASLLTYLLYLEKRSIAYYALAVFLFVCSMLSKPMAASLPAVLFLTDFYYSRKFSWKMALEKLPFIAIAIFIMLIPMQHAAAAPANPDAFGYSFHKNVPFIYRVFLSCYAFLYYIIKTILPVNLSAYHGFPSTDAGLPILYYVSPAAIILLFFLAFRSGHLKKQLLSGLLFYTVTIAIVIHLVPFGTNIYLAERYAYIPFIGILFIAASLYASATEKAPTKTRSWRWGIAAIAVVFAFLTYQQNKTWKDSTALWTHAIKVTPDDFYGYFNRGNEEKTLKQTQAAIDDYNEAIRLNPAFMEGYYNRALAKADMQDYNGAITDYTKAVEINPCYYVSWFNRANAKAALGDFPGAISDYNEALKYKPDYKEAYANRGNAKGAMKDFAGSIEDYNKVLQLNPNEAQAYGNRAISRLNLNDRKGACEDLSVAVSLGDEHSAMVMQQFCK